MKITLVCDILGKEDNGTTIATMNLARHLQKNNEVRILCCDKTKKGKSGYYVTDTKKFPGRIGKFVDSTGFQLARVNKKIVEEACEGADVIHCLEPFALSIAATKYARRHNIPVTAAVHLLPEHLLYYLHIRWIVPLNWSIYKYWWNKIYKHVQAIHYPTEFDRQLFTQKNKKANKKKTYVISNGICESIIIKHVDKPKEIADKFIILCVGRFSPEKAQPDLIKSMQYSKYADKIQLVFAGQGQKKLKYEILAKKYAVNKPIFYRYTHDELVDVYNYADIVVHPATLETEGIAVLEAMKLGKLVLISDAKKSAPKTFGFEKECIFKANNPRSLAATIDYWLDHPNLIKKYGQNNLKRTSDSAAKNCLDKTEQMLKDAVQNANKK